MLGAGAFTAAACSNGQATTPSINAAAAGSESLLYKWQKTGKARLGVDLSFPPIQYIDPATHKPTGYQVELTEMMMTDLGITPEWVQIPFAELFAGLAANKFDMSGISATILPSRALKVGFADFPVYYESNVILLKPGSKVTTLAQLNTPGTVVAVLLGSSQQYTGQLILPKAKILPLSLITDQVNEVATGRADAVLFSTFNLAQAFSAYPNLKMLPVGTIFVDANAYFMPLGDYMLRNWVTNWLRYYAAHNTLKELWLKWFGNQVISQYHIPVVAVDPGGDAETVGTVG